MQVYLVSHCKCVVGIFSNRTWMIAKIGHLFDKCHIIGARKNISVTANSIGTHMPNGYLPIYDEGGNIVYRIWKLNVNSVNPQYKEYDGSKV